MHTFKRKVLFKDLGLIDYKHAWNYQENIFKRILKVITENYKRTAEQQIYTEDYLFFCEHPHVFTLGKSGSESNLLIKKNLLDKYKVEYYKTNRGGDITYHGPGQIVGYPVLDLDHFAIGIKDYVNKLEEIVIRTLKHYDIHSERLNDATGVWLDPDNQKEARKICAIGVKTSRYVAMHGFAFNVNTDLSYYNLINPCGFTDRGITSMEKELGKKQNIDDIKETLKEKFSEVLNCVINDMN